MKLPPLDYLAPTTLADAVAALAADEDAKVIAGGQSLMPLLALRLARPTLLVDVTGLGLDGVGLPAPGTSGRVRLGAALRQRRIETDPALAAAVPLLADAVTQVGYAATRNLGTLGGSLAHADPVAELPAVVVALGGTVVAVGPGGAREIPAAGLASGWFTTTLKPDEILTEILLPVGAGVATVAAFREWSPRAHDFATAGVGVSLDLDADGTCVAVAAAACGAGATPLVLSEVLGAAGLLGWVCRPGAEPAASLLRAVAAATTGACGDGDPDRAELAGLLAARAVRAACRRRVAPAVAA